MTRKMPGATEVQNAWTGKEQVVNDVPKVIKELHFGVLCDVFLAQSPVHF